MPEIQYSPGPDAEQQKRLEDQLLKTARSNRINCSSALAIAKSLGVSPVKVGETANKLKIKISKCQLGCF